MQATATRKIVSHAIVAVTLAVAAVASWAITSDRAPLLEAAVTTPSKG